jgi:peptide subunit release factor 1 (eRF1)
VLAPEVVEPVSGQVIDRLLHFRSAEAPVLSVYVAIPFDPHERRGVHARLESMLQPVKDLAYSDRLEHYPRESLRSDIDRIMGLTDRAREFGGRAMAAFACHQEKLYEEVVLPRPVRDRAVLDATPYLRPLLAVLDETHRYCVAVIDREHAWIYEFFMGRLEDKETAHGRALRQPNYAGGWQGYKEDKTHHKAELLGRRHFREAAERIEQVVRRTGAEFIILGGHEETVTEFLPFLPHYLQPKVAGTFVVDPSTMTPGRVREQADQVADAYERMEETQLVADALEKVAAGGFAAAGLDWCLLAVDEQAVQLLLVHDDEEAPGRACDNCGWLGLDREECPVCGHGTRQTPDVIDEMAAAVIDAGGRVEHVYADTPLSGHVVAALLRFPVPRPLSAMVGGTEGGG